MPTTRLTAQLTLLLSLLLSVASLALSGCQDDVPGCASDDECRAGRVCIARTCQDPDAIDGDQDAGNNATNNGANNGANNRANNGDIDAGNNGTPDVDLPDCAVDEDCANGLYCAPDTRTCESGCRPGQCGVGTCDLSSRQCVAAPCGSDAECAASDYCAADGQCTTGCRANGCPLDQTCDLATRACLGAGCNLDADCADTEYCGDSGACLAGCRAGSCADGESCDFTTRTCVPVGCTSDIDCDADAYCTADGACVAGCRAGGCDAGSVCDLNTRQCVTEGCALDTDCAANEYCGDGVCAAGCRANGCAADQLCDLNTRQCVSSGCTADADCAGDAYCAADGACAPGCRLGGCAVNETCNPQSRTCDPLVTGPEIDVQPLSVDFGEVGVNTSVFADVVVSNLGSEPLVIFEVAFGRGPTSEGFQIIPPSADLPLVIAPGDSVVYRVRFEPRRITTMGQAYLNQVVFRSNDADEPTVSVEIAGTGVATTGACLRFADRDLDFGYVPVGEVASREVALQNCGASAIDVDSIAIEGDADGVFSLLVGGTFPRSLPAGQTLNVVVNYLPQAVASQQVTLVATAGPDLTALALVVADGPCLRFSETLVSFGSVPPGEAASAQVRLENCGESSLDLTGVTLTGPDADVFSLLIGGAFPRALGPGNNLTLVINYVPTDFSPRAATLLATTTGTTTAQLSVTADGPGCPELVLFGQTDPDAAPSQGALQGAVGAPVMVDGTDSFDPAGGELSWQWTLTAPDGSEAFAVAPGDTAGSFTFTPDVGGLYEIVLSATSLATGVEACEPVTLRVLVPAVEVRLTWDDRSDLDLHVVRGGADGFSPIGSSQDLNPEDCYFANATPDWGVIGARGDDPAFLGDDTNGFGPEVVLFPSIEPSRRYQIVARMSRPGSFQATPMVVAVIVDGVETRVETTIQAFGTEVVVAVIEGDGTVVPQP